MTNLSVLHLFEREEVSPNAIAAMYRSTFFNLMF